MNDSSQPVRVLLADDHTLVRAGMRALLEKLPGVIVVAEANDGREVLELTRTRAPAVVIMDIAMPGLNGLEAADRLAKEFPQVRVVILSMHHQEEYLYRALKTGVIGYLLKKAATAELEIALKTVLRGEVYLSAEIAKNLPATFRLDRIAAQRSPLERLSGRQREILQLVAEGQNTKQIAAQLQISPKTVEYHRAKLMEVLNLHDVPGLVRFAIRAGLIQSET